MKKYFILALALIMTACAITIVKHTDKKTDHVINVGHHK